VAAPAGALLPRNPVEDEGLRLGEGVEAAEAVALVVDPDEAGDEVAEVEAATVEGGADEERLVGGQGAARGAVFGDGVAEGGGVGVGVGERVGGQTVWELRAQ